MSYRPITDVWFLARAKLKEGRKYYGAYLGGFPERARVLIGVRSCESLLHVCGGMARHYPYKGGFGPRDMTLDMNPATEPDFEQNALNALPKCPYTESGMWLGILADPPYSAEDAEHYIPGRENYPSPSAIVENCLRSVRVGSRVGIIHYILPRCPKWAKFVACVGVFCGFNNRARCFSVFERRQK